MVVVIFLERQCGVMNFDGITIERNDVVDL